MLLKRIGSACAIAALSLSASSALAATADIVFIVDESGSMGGEQAFITDVIADLDTALGTAGITGQYSLVGFGDRDEVPRLLIDSGTAVNATAAASGFRTNGGTEDGYAGMAFGLSDITLDADATNFILVTDEDRDDIVGPVCSGTCLASWPTGVADSFSEMLTALNGGNVVLNAILDQDLLDGALGFDGVNSYAVDGTGGFTETVGGGLIQTSDTTTQDYSNLAIATDGAVWDLNILRNGGADAESFAAAFIDIKVREVRDQIDTGTPNDTSPVPLPAAGWMLLAGLGGMAAMRRRKKAA